MTERTQLEQAIATLENQRDILGDVTVDTALGPMLRQLAELKQAEEKDAYDYGGERKLVTVMFADITGFTALSEKLDPEAVRELVNARFDRLVPIIKKNQGLVEKFIGDEIMAIFGAPVAHENDPELALQTALEMMDELAVFNSEQNMDIGMHIGVSTGMVIAGGIGVKGQQVYGVLGEVVSFASKLADNAEKDEILVGENTRRLTVKSFEFKLHSTIQLKGRNTPEQVFSVQCAKPRSFHRGRWGMQSIDASMIGRDAELSTLKDSLNRAIVSQKTTLVTVLGDAGVGKSRLLYEFESWLESQTGDLAFFKGRCTQQRQGVANNLLRDLLAFHFGITESDPIDIVRAKFEKGIRATLPGDGGLKAQILGAWLGYDFGHSPHVSALRGDAEQLRNRGSLYLGQFFQAFVANSPTVIFIEDLHWADSGSLNAIMGFCRRYPDLPIFILCLARSRLLLRRPRWGNDILTAHYEQIDLSPLAENEVRILVGELLQQAEDVPSNLIEFVASRSEGNPYYVEELVQMLIDQDVIHAVEKRWQVDLEKLTNLQVPDTLTAVLQARLDRLSPFQKQAIQQAAVVGRVFWDAVLSEFGTNSESRLSDLTKRNLVVPQQTSAFSGTEEYVFKHALLRDVTYETLVKRMRRSYHQLVGAWLIEIAEANGRTDEFAAIIGEHYEMAGETDVAAEWYGQAGRLAAGQFDQEAAESLLSQALALLSTRDYVSRYDLLLVREGVYHLGGEREKQAADLALLMELVKMEEKNTNLPNKCAVQVLIRKAAYAGAVSDYPEAISAASEALTRAKTAEDNQLVAASLVHWGSALWRQGNYSTARDRFLEGKALAKSAGVNEDLADCLKGLGIVAYEQGDYSQAHEEYQAALKIFQEIGDRQGESACLGNLGLIAADQGKYIEARKYHKASLEICQEIGYRRGEGIRLNNLGVVARDQGDYSGAKKYHTTALGIFREISYQRGESICLINLGVLALNQKDYLRAREYFETSLTIAREIGFRSGEGLVLHDLGELARVGKDLTEAERFFRQALRLRQELGQQYHVVEDKAGLARVALDRGELEIARELIAPVLIYLGQNPTMDGAMHPYRIPLICGQVLRATGELSQAREIAGAASLAWATLAENLPNSEERDRFLAVPEYVALRHFCIELGEIKGNYL